MWRSRSSAWLALHSSNASICLSLSLSQRVICHPRVFMGGEVAARLSQPVQCKDRKSQGSTPLTPRPATLTTSKLSQQHDMSNTNTLVFTCRAVLSAFLLLLLLHMTYRTCLISNYQHSLHFDSISLISTTTESCYTLIVCWQGYIQKLFPSASTLLVFSLSVKNKGKQRRNSCWCITPEANMKPK